ncbi:MAG: Maf family protein [Candidatus Borkfalkiaceae bacterium]|nr:Maf family protein [Clostridia bacterium]MDY6223890.1 Maf family protein [Christensenellaceae bacterium]
MEFVLASASPRRRELLKKIVGDFEIDAAKSEEKADDSFPPRQTVEFLAKQKAEEIAAKKEHAGKTVLGADTVVTIDGKILGKPKDKRQAKEMLRLLSGREHVVVTGVCLIFPNGEKDTAYDETRVKFSALSEEFIENYVAGGSPMDKAGAYGIQDGIPVEYIRGSYDNVVGLPTELLCRMLSRRGKDETDIGGNTNLSKNRTEAEAQR